MKLLRPLCWSTKDYFSPFWDQPTLIKAMIDKLTIEDARAMILKVGTKKDPPPPELLEAMAEKAGLFKEDGSLARDLEYNDIPNMQDPVEKTLWGNLSPQSQLVLEQFEKRRWNEKKMACEVRIEKESGNEICLKIDEKGNLIKNDQEQENVLNSKCQEAIKEFVEALEKKTNVYRQWENELTSRADVDWGDLKQNYKINFDGKECYFLSEKGILPKDKEQKTPGCIYILSQLRQFLGMKHQFTK